MSALLTTFGIDWHLLFANAVNFIVLAVLLTWLLYKPVMKIVAEREAVIAKGVTDAEKAAQRLADADASAHSRIQAAEKEAADIFDSARQSANETKAQMLKEAEERAAKVASDAEARASEAAAKALRDSEKEIARLAILAAAKIAREQA